MADYQHQLPSFSDIQDEKAYENMAIEGTDFEKNYIEFLKLVHKPCPDKWLKKHPIIPNYRYLPVDKVEFSLHRIFGAMGWRAEILSAGSMFNSSYCIVRLHYKIPNTNVWMSHDGVGAAPCHTKGGEAAANLSAIKSDAVTKSLPTSASYALKNAARKIGELFGANVDDYDAISFFDQEGTFKGLWQPPPSQPPATSTSNGEIPKSDAELKY